MIVSGPITVARRKESSNWLSLVYVSRASRIVFLEETGRGCCSIFFS